DATAVSLAELPPGAYRLIMGAYYGDFSNLRVPVTQAATNAPNDMATLGWIKVPQHAMPEPDDNAMTYDAVLGDQQFALIGGSAEPVNADEPGKIRLRLTWQALADRPTLDATIFVHVLGAEDTFITQNDARPWNGQYPTFIWDAGEIVQTEHLLDIGDTPLAEVNLIAGMYFFISSNQTQRLDVVQDGESVPQQVITLGNLGELVKTIMQ
ncbi:MAG: hypothetical protein JXA10_04215, partial [Anaerolineae bacterium]|nr:hypothetical protein [Anaerolineae bacterium]